MNFHPIPSGPEQLCDVMAKLIMEKDFYQKQLFNEKIKINKFHKQMLVITSCYAINGCSFVSSE